MSITAAAHAEPLHVTRATGPISIDGKLDDPGWQNALRFDTWYETSPGDNIPPAVKTIGWLTYDDRFVYVAIRCFDPNPGEIRVQHADRDFVSGANDDAVAVVLDTHNDGKTGLELYVTAGGTQGDALENDATGAEDFRLISSGTPPSGSTTRVGSSSIGSRSPRCGITVIMPILCSLRTIGEAAPSYCRRRPVPRSRIRTFLRKSALRE